MKFRATNLMIGTLALAYRRRVVRRLARLPQVAGIKQQVPFRVVFEGSASGLRKGGSVNFAGIRVGEVVSLKLDNPRRVVALTRSTASTPVRKDTAGGAGIPGPHRHCRDLVHRRHRSTARRPRSTRTAFPC